MSPWIHEAVSNTCPFFSVKKCNYPKKTSKKLKSPHGYRTRFPTHIPFFQSESVIIQKKNEKTQNSPWIQEAVSNTYPFFQSESVIIQKKVGKTQKSPWIQAAVSNTYPFFHSENVIIQKKSKKLKSPHGCKRRFQIHVPLFSQKV